MDIRSHLRAEHARRRARNPRYSLRAFALGLGVSHSTLSRLLRGDRRLTRATVDRVAARLGLTPLDAARARLADGADAILALVERRGFRPDSRWLATMTGLPIDDVNTAIHSLLHARRLTLASPVTWHREAP